MKEKSVLSLDETDFFMSLGLRSVAGGLYG